MSETTFAPDPLPAVPTMLKEIPNWVSWKLVDGTKPPLIVGTDRTASTADSSTWVDFETAVTKTAINGVEGVGFVLGGLAIEKKLIGVDLDGCLNPKTHEVAPWAEKIVDLLDSYTEKTPSGLGLRIWVIGLWPFQEHVIKLDPAAGFGDKVQIEVYSQSRYFTVTGDAWSIFPAEIERRDLTLFHNLCRDIQAQWPPKAKTTSTSAGSIAEGVKIESAPAAPITDKYELLMRGIVSGDKPLVITDGFGNSLTYDDRSGADMALCTASALKHGDHPDAIWKDYENSCLFRPKWENREEDFRRLTIAKAIATVKKMKEAVSAANSHGPQFPAATESAEQTATRTTAQVEENQKEYDTTADSAARSSEQADALANLEYPIHIWEGTPYYDFALLAQGVGNKLNYIPLSYSANGLMTVTGAICGHRISPEFSPNMPANFNTVFLSTVGGIGKNEVFNWSRGCYRDTGLLYQSGFPPNKNIGACHDDFASARALISAFAEHPRILQEYAELTTLIEKFGIEGSGEAFLNFILNSYDSTFPNWSRVKGFKLPNALPEEINNCLLGATIVRKWNTAMQGEKLETFIQRINIIHTNEIRTVPILWTPDTYSIREKLMSRVGLLEEFRLAWLYSPEAETRLHQWHESLHERKLQLDPDSNEHEAFGRIQVFVHRIVGHLALWKGDLPLVNGVRITSRYLEDFKDKNGNPAPRIRRAEGTDKPWKIEAPLAWLEGAIEAAEYLISARKELLPPPGTGTMGKIQNQIVKWAVKLRYAAWPELRRRANLGQYDYQMVESSLLSLQKAGLLHINGDPQNQQARNKWIVVWDGDGTHKRHYKETRGGAREGSGPKPRKNGEGSGFG